MSQHLAKQAISIQASALRLTSVGLLLLLVQCQSTLQTKVEDDPCLRKDWYEVGRRDGQQGQTLAVLEAHQMQCANSRNAPNTDAYLNGRNSGLNDFCLPQSGFEAGRQGVNYESVCPEHMESSFLAQHRLGAAVRRFELDNNTILQRIVTLQSQLRKFSNSPAAESGAAAVKAATTEAVKAELADLGKRLSTNELAIGNLEIEADTLASQASSAATQKKDVNILRSLPQTMQSADGKNSLPGSRQSSDTSGAEGTNSKSLNR